MRAAILGLSLMLAGGAISPAFAGPASDAFGRCLVQSSTGRDRLNLVRWIFAAMAQHPEVKALSSLTPQQRMGYARDAGATVERLLTKDCRAESVAAIREGGPVAFQQAFQLFGQTAVQELITDPAVQGEFAGLANSMDKDALESLAKEAAGKP